MTTATTSRLTPREAFVALGYALTEQPREERRDAFGRPVVTRWCRITPAACSRIGATGEGPDDATAEARLDNDLRATLRGLLAYAEADALAAVASPRRGHAGAAAAASWRNRVRALVGGAVSPQPSLLAAVLRALASRPTAPLGQPPNGRAKTPGKQAVPQLF